ncbi:hypothetical protein H6P81_006600 [Aristolochia fimbriata]|uniref:Uncharacterized protein n=1 Tax=Aristolochia fimbriata TaxID=158543 RepID=A0AAV7EYZ7_ARIFI|nr:hypothetical protein H6P81_006600 [Aristolochia fimbriata]
MEGLGGNKSRGEAKAKASASEASWKVWEGIRAEEKQAQVKGGGDNARGGIKKREAALLGPDSGGMRGSKRRGDAVGWADEVHGASTGVAACQQHCLGHLPPLSGCLGHLPPLLSS